MISKTQFTNEKTLFNEEPYKVGPQELQKVLHRSIGALTSYHKNERSRRTTGILIFKNIVLVAASSLYNKHQNYSYEYFKFYLPDNVFGMKQYEIQSYLIPPQFAKIEADKRLEFDYGLLKLKQEVNYKQFPQFAISCEKCLVEKNKQTLLEIYGYPAPETQFASNEQDTYMVLQQHGSRKKNAIVLVQPGKNVIGYSINTVPGQTGSPIIANGKIIGTHIGVRYYTDPFTIGRLFDKNLVRSIAKMCEEMKGKFFNVLQFECIHTKPQYLKLKEETYKSRLKRGYYDNQYPYEEQNALISQEFEVKYNLKERWETLQQNFLNKYLPKQQQIKYLKQLNLKSSKGQKYKLTSYDMESLAKMQLNFLVQINLQNNRLTNRGLQIICRCQYPYLELIYLDDNDITINGLRFILFNKWSLKVKYYLYAVYSNDNGYYLNVGESLPIMKKIVQAKNMNEVDYLIPTQKNKTLNAINLLLQTPLEQQNNKQLEYTSMQIQKKYQEESKKNKYSLPSVLLKLKQNFGDTLIFTEKTNIKSNLSSKIIFTGLFEERVRVEIRQKSFKNYNFSDFRYNYKKLFQFSAEYMEYLSKKFEVQRTDMTIDKIVEGSIIVNLSDSLTNASVHNKSFVEEIPNNIKLFFEKLRLAEGQFDEKGNLAFPKIQNSSLQVRGGFPYYQPVLGKRFGIRVNNLYDKGNNNWLMMNGNKDQWAIAFHGTPNSNIRSIMDGRLQGNMLKQGRRQQYKDGRCLKNGSIVGTGIYTSPYFLDCLFDYSKNQSQEFYLVLQCRAKPSSIKIPQNRPNYWVINNRQQLRPYGIILYTKRDIQLLKGADSTISAIQKRIYRNKQFTQQTWNNICKSKYLSFINKK